MTSAYIRSLQAEAERARIAEIAAGAAKVEADRQAEVRAARERLTPLEDRLAKVLATIPREVTRDGLSLPTLVPLLRGRRCATANPGQLGVALRQLGWRRERKWRGGDLGFSALWYPPAAA